MKLLKISALAAVPFVFALAGCNTVNKTNTTAGAATSSGQAAATQGAEVGVFAASNTAIKGYQTVRLNEQRVIYVSPRALINRSHIRAIDYAQDNQGRSFVKLSLNPQGVALLNSVPASQGYATTVAGQLASLTGVRQGSDFLFNVRDQQVAASVIQAIVPQQARR